MVERKSNQRWKVELDSNVGSEGEFPKDLGTFFGYISDIALMLAEKVTSPDEYLVFKPMKEEKTTNRTATGHTVAVMVYKDTGGKYPMDDCELEVLLQEEEVSVHSPHHLPHYVYQLEAEGSNKQEADKYMVDKILNKLSQEDKDLLRRVLEQNIGG